MECFNQLHIPRRQMKSKLLMFLMTCMIFKMFKRTLISTSYTPTYCGLLDHLLASSKGYSTQAVGKINQRWLNDRL